MTILFRTVWLCCLLSCSATSVDFAPPPRASRIEIDGSGAVVIGPRFSPIPYPIGGMVDPDVDAATLSEGCRGWIARRTFHELRLTERFERLRVMAFANRMDPTLVLRRPDGRYECADDSDGVFPVIDGTFDAGTYRVWVGHYRKQPLAYTLGLSTEPSSPAELPAPATPPGLDDVPRLSTSSRSISREGASLDIVSGGALPASELVAGCGGWVSRRADVSIALDEPLPFVRVRVPSYSRDRAGVIVERPDGTRLCAGGGFGSGEPTLTLEPAPVGLYLVWGVSPQQDQGESIVVVFDAGGAARGAATSE